MNPFDFVCNQARKLHLIGSCDLTKPRYPCHNLFTEKFFARGRCTYKISIPFSLLENKLPLCPIEVASKANKEALVPSTHTYRPSRMEIPPGLTLDNYLTQLKGFWLTPSDLHATEEILTQFKPLPNDVILASFPKTGTTWLKSLLYSIVNRSSMENLVRSHPQELVPQLEAQVYGPLASSHPFPSLDTSSSNRIFSTHLPYQIFGEAIDSSDCRVVYVARNPKDTLVSMWHFLNSLEMLKTSPWPLEDFVDNFCKGHVGYGPYYDHVLGYHKASMEKPKKFFFITYEELKSDPKTCVKKLAEFLGYPFDNEDQAEEVVRSCSIETLRNHEVNKSTGSFGFYGFPYNSYFRKGQVGDHKNFLTKDMIDLIDATTNEKFQGSIFKDETDSLSFSV